MISYFVFLSHVMIFLSKKSFLMTMNVIFPINGKTVYWQTGINLFLDNTR